MDMQSLCGRTMTDKELLELAAKAAGYKMHPEKFVGDYWLKDGMVWNPLTDDGDALRLAVKLNVDVIFDFDRVMAVYGNGYSKEEYFYELPEPTDKYTATRRAIVRAAAEIGKAL
jgi:hypothetical protein